MKRERNPQIGLMITQDGVKGCAVFGETLEERQNSLALLDLLEPDLIQIQGILDSRIRTLLKEKNALYK